jgi:hypothetical protein
MATRRSWNLYHETLEYLLGSVMLAGVLLFSFVAHAFSSQLGKYGISETIAIYGGISVIVATVIVLARKSPSRGELLAVRLVGTAQTPLVLLTVESKIKHQKHSSRVLCHENGSYLRTLSTKEDVLQGSVGYFCDESESLRLFDLVTGETLVDVGKELSRRGEGSSFRVRVIDQEAHVLWPNGKSEIISLLGYVANTALLAQSHNQDLLQSPQAQIPSSSREPNKQELLRASAVASPTEPNQTLVYSLGTSRVQFVLHASTAFGEGDVLFSAVSVDSPQPLWTYNITSHWGKDEIWALYDPCVEGGRLHFWLLRRKRGLYRVSLAADSGEEQEAHAVF